MDRNYFIRLDAALKEVMAHAVAGHQDSGYHHYCNASSHAHHIINEHGFGLEESQDWGSIEELESWMRGTHLGGS